MAEMRRVALTLLLQVLSADCLGHADHLEESSSVGLSFTAIGDWGGESDEQPTTPSQQMTAAGLASVTKRLGANFTLLMGDNFYTHGIHAPAAISTRFRETFEDVYSSRLPGHCFYALAGNHDYGEGVMANVSAQVEYSTISEHWNFPSLWYKIQKEFKADGQVRTLDVLAIDTVVLCGMPWIEWMTEHHFNEELKFTGRTRRELAAEQWAWLERELNESRAEFLWVTGHYPIWSGGADGSTGCLIKHLRPLLKKYGAHYISGHDHMLEHFKDGELNTFVVGAGMECCYPPEKLWRPPRGSAQFVLAGSEGSESIPPVPFPVYGGFASFMFGAEHATVTLHAHNGSALYVAAPILRRNLGVLQGHALGDVAVTTLGATEPTFLPVAGIFACAGAMVALALAVGLLRSRRQEMCRQSDAARAPLLQVSA